MNTFGLFLFKITVCVTTVKSCSLCRYETKIAAQPMSVTFCSLITHKNSPRLALNRRVKQITLYCTLFI